MSSGAGKAASRRLAATPMAGGSPALGAPLSRPLNTTGGLEREQSSPGPVTARNGCGYRLAGGGVAGALLAVFGWTIAGLVSVSGCRAPPVIWASGPLSVNVASLNWVPVGAAASAKAGAASVSPVGIEVEM